MTFAEPRSTLAPAKINLTLRIFGRRADGLHEHESLVAFAPFGDRLTLWPNATLDLKVSGPMAAGTGPLADNLVLRAARALAAHIDGLRLGRFALFKRLPSGAGLGGGSADAAAALRLIAEVNHLGLNDERIHAAARATGADIPVCLDPWPRVMRGIGEILSTPLVLPKLGILIVHPGVALPTGPVFKALGLGPGEQYAGSSHPPQRGQGDCLCQDTSPPPGLPSRSSTGEGRGEGVSPQTQAHGAALVPTLSSPGGGKGGDDLSPQAQRGQGCSHSGLPWHAEKDTQSAQRDALLTFLASECNDLESAAISVAPQIADVLRAIAELAGCRLARMSGSGSACFGLFNSARAAVAAARDLAAARPSWWVRAGLLGN